MKTYRIAAIAGDGIGTRSFLRASGYLRPLRTNSASNSIGTFSIGVANAMNGRE